MFQDGVLIAGSGGDGGDTVELYVPSSGVSCSLPKLPVNGIRYQDHTLENTGLICGGADTSNFCLQWSPDTGSWEEGLLLGIERAFHVSWTPAPTYLGTFLMGGARSERKTTLINYDGTQEAAFPLKYDT